MIVPDQPASGQAVSSREQAAELYALTFAGRTDAHSTWNGKGWQSVRQPLTGHIVLHAFDTGIPISSYFVAADNATHIAALDLDLPDGYHLGKRFLGHLREVGGLGYVEASRRGGHVWIPLSDRRPVIQIRFALRALLAEAKLPDDPKIELRPGSDRLGEAREGEAPPLGHCLRMPTMPHPKTNKRYGLLSSNGEQLPGLLVDMMLALEECPVEVIEAAAERAPLPEIEIRPPRELLHPYGEKEGKGNQPYSESAIKIMQDLWGVQDALYPGRGFHCPAHDDTNKSAMVHRSDERIICWNPECWLSNDFRGRGTWELTKNASKRGG